MTNKQLLVYGAIIRLAWFQKAKELGSVSAACSLQPAAITEFLGVRTNTGKTVSRKPVVE